MFCVRQSAFGIRQPAAGKYDVAVPDRLRPIASRQNPLVKELRRAFHQSEPTPDGFVAIESVEQAEELTRPLPDEFYALARKFWPGPLTIIVKAAPRLPLKVTANTGNVALRVPAAQIPMAVIHAAGVPITATSANLSGGPECTSAVEVRDQLRDRISIIVDGGLSPRAVASTIVDLSENSGEYKVLREGAIPQQEIVETLG